MQPNDEPNELDLFAAAIERPVDQRSVFLDEACCGNPDLRARIEILLAIDQQAERAEFLTPTPLNLKGTFATPPETGLLLSRQMGAFRIVELIGRGGMGEVYLARRTEDYAQDVAIKVLRRVVDSDELVRRFRTETQFMAALGKHPNIAGLIDAGTTDDGLLYLVMEYVDGQPIDGYCDKQKLNNDHRLTLFLDVCDAVQFAHQNTVIHRDLKPSNILVSHDGQVQLIDFGIAKLANPEAGADTESTRTLFRVLTPDYASPEQARGEPPTTATDVYSLGIVLYGLLTGRSPYEVDTTDPQKLAHLIEHVQPVHPAVAVSQTAFGAPPSEKIARNRRVSPERLKRQLGGDLSTIVLMALRKEPQRRYATADQLTADIRSYLSGRPVRARKDTFRYRAAKFVLRNRVAVSVAAVLCLTLLAGIVGTGTQWMRAQQERRRAELNAKEAVAEAARAGALARSEADARAKAQAAERAASIAAREARQKAETAQQVSDFMVRLFQGADRFGFLAYQFGPTPKQDADPTATQLLARGTQRLEADLRDQPVVRAALKTKIAQVYLTLGSLPKAEPLLLSGLAAQRQLAAQVPPADRIDTLATLGIVRYIQGRYEESKAFLREAVALGDETFGEMDPRGASTKLVLGTVVMEAASTTPGDWEEAKRILRQVVTIRESEEHVSPYDMALAYIGEAIVERSNGHNGKAFMSLGKASKLLAFTPGGKDYLRTWFLGVQASVNWQQGSKELAYRQTEEVLKLAHEMLGSKHPAVSYIQVDSARRMYAAGEHKKAEALLRDGILSARQAYGRQPRTASALLTLGTQLLKRGTKLDESEALLNESVEIFTDVLGADSLQARRAKAQHQDALAAISARRRE